MADSFNLPPPKNLFIAILSVFYILKRIRIGIAAESVQIQFHLKENCSHNSAVKDVAAAKSKPRMYTVSSNNRETDRQRKRKTDRQTIRQYDIQTEKKERKTERQTEKQTE